MMINFIPLINSGEKPMEMDHHLYEFGAVEYHIQVKPPYAHLLSVYLDIF